MNNPLILSKRRAPAFNCLRHKNVILPRHKIGVGNEFRVEVIKEGRGVRYLGPWIPNHVTDQGLDLWTSSRTATIACQVGTGNTAPSDADTGLQSATAGTSSFSKISRTVQNDTSPYYVEDHWRYDFPVGTFNDDILAELMVGTASSGGDCFSRELIRDAVGDPTTVQIADDEELRIHHKVRVYPPMVDVIGTVDLTIRGVITNHDFTRRASRANGEKWAFRDSSGGGNQNALVGVIEPNQRPTAYSGGLGTILSNPSSSLGTCTSVTTQAYSTGTFQRDAEIFFDTADGNGDIRCLEWWFDDAGFPSGPNANSGSFQCELYPVIEKTGLDVLTFEITTMWDRYLESSV